MIKLETKYDTEKDVFSINYSAKNTCTFEHLYTIRCLVDKILENDILMSIDDISSIIRNHLIEIKRNEKKARKAKKESDK